MKLIFIGIIWLGITTWQGTVFGEGCGGCGTCNDSTGCSVTGEKSERFCTNGHKKELKKLLQELHEISLQTGSRTGGRSEVRRKYRIARKLRNFDDCCAREALRKLIKENACEDLGEGELFCVKWGAELSLFEVESKKDLKKLTPDASIADQVTIIKKYGRHPHKNEFASHEVKKYLVKQMEKDPDFYVPFLVEYFPHCHELSEIAEKYPSSFDIGLKRSFYSPDPTVVWNTIYLARKTGRVRFLKTVYGVAFEEIGPLDYSKTDDIEEIQNAAIGFFRMFEKDAVPYYRAILYSQYERKKEYVISGIKDSGNNEIMTMLKEFSSYLASNPKKAGGLLASRVQKKIAEMEGVQR